MSEEMTAEPAPTPSEPAALPVVIARAHSERHASIAERSVLAIAGLGLAPLPALVAWHFFQPISFFQRFAVPWPVERIYGGLLAAGIVIGTPLFLLLWRLRWPPFIAALLLGWLATIAAFAVLTEAPPTLAGLGTSELAKILSAAGRNLPAAAVAWAQPAAYFGATAGFFFWFIARPQRRRRR